MSPRPHEGTAEEGLSSSLLQAVHEPERLDCLRSMLSAFCHRCRNSLNGIKLSLYLFRREARGTVPNCWDELEAIYHQLEDLFDRLQTIYRPMSITVVQSPLDDLIGHHVPKWRSWYESRGRALEVEPPEAKVRGEFDPAQLGVGLDALASWRAESAEAGTLTQIGWKARDGWIEIRWEESGAWASGEPLESAHEVGATVRGRSSRRVDALALPLLARIVAAHGGVLRRDARSDFGLTLRWPLSQPADRGGVQSGFDARTGGIDGSAVTGTAGSAAARSLCGDRESDPDAER